MTIREGPSTWGQEPSFLCLNHLPAQYATTNEPHELAVILLYKLLAADPHHFLRQGSRTAKMTGHSGDHRIVGHQRDLEASSATFVSGFGGNTSARDAERLGEIGFDLAAPPVRCLG